MSSLYKQNKANITFLVVDDDPVARNILTTILISEGCSVFSAKCADSALKLFTDDPTISAQEIDIALIDIVLPKTSGIELADRLQAMGFKGHLVFLTACQDDELPQDLIKNYDAMLLAKPFTAEDIVVQIGHLLKKKSLDIQSL